MANRLYASAIVVDATAPLPPFGAVEISSTPDQLVDAYVRSGVTHAVFTVVDDFPNSIEQTVKLLGLNRRFFLSRPDRFVLADNADDIRRAKAEGKFAAAFGFQGSNALLGELSLIEVYRRLGVVQMLLAYNSANLVADGCHEHRNAGLTQFGRRVVAEMNRVGMIVDLSHVGVRSSLEAIDLSTKPPIFSHSTPKMFAAHDRNVSDEQIRACAAKQGIIGLTGLGPFMDGVTQRVTLERFADTIEYVMQLVGSAHAAIGLDYVIDRDSMARYLRSNPEVYGGGSQYSSDGYTDFAPPSMLGEVSETLIRRGYTDADVRGVLGENYLRVLQANG
jgi:membrane dipeptidase